MPFTHVNDDGSVRPMTDAEVKELLGLDPLRTITIRTRHPEDYLLLNLADRSAWRYDEQARPRRVTFPEEGVR